MLVSLYLPFSDLRGLRAIGFRRLERPEWPTPPSGDWHLRGIGSIRDRRKRGLEGWVGEDHLAVGLRALALSLPYADPTCRLGRLRLVRKACYFDGLLNGRFELLVSTEYPASDAVTAREICETLAETEATIRFQEPGAAPVTAPLRAATRHVARFWAQATVRHGADPAAAGVRARRPVCIIESDEPIEGIPAFGRLSGQAAKLAAREGVKFGDLRVGASADQSRSTPRFDRLLVSVCDRAGVQPQTRRICRFFCRYLRTYTFRIFQDVECVSLLLGDDLIDWEDPRVTFFLNEYTRRINRAHQRLDDFAAGELIGLAYASFEALYPGHIDSLRVRVVNSGIRPNIAKKILQLLGRSQSAGITNVRYMKVENIMGDKFENVKVSGSQGVAVGRGASATVSGSQNINREDLSRDLRVLADLVRAKTDRPDAAVEAGLVEKAAAKVDEGKDEDAASLLKSAAGWVLDIAKAAGGVALGAYLKASLSV